MVDDRAVRDYLLGRLPEGNREAIESKAIEDADFYLTMRSVEDDLFDDFARGDLAAADRDAFLQRYGDQQDRMLFARALAKRTSNVVPFRRRSWIGWAAAAAVAAVVVGTAVVSQRPASDPPATVTPIARRPVDPAPAPAPPSVILTVAIASSRSSSTATEVVLPEGAGAIDLRVRIHPEDRFARYAMRLESAAGIVWRAEALEAKSQNGDLVVASPIPAGLLAESSYELAVSGVDTSGPAEDLGFVTLNIKRKR